MREYFPRSEAAFHTWQGILVTILLENAAAWGIPADVLAELQNLQKLWTQSYQITSNKMARTSADVTQKNEAKDAYQQFLRKLIKQWLSLNPKIDDADRTRMQIAISRKKHNSIPVPQTAPMAQIDFSVRLQHRIRFYDSESNLRNAKPYGIVACHIYLKIGGEAPVSKDEMHFYGACSATPALVNFEPAQAGKRAWYWLCWVNTKGQTGPWSVVVSAMIVN